MGKGRGWWGVARGEWGVGSGEWGVGVHFAGNKPQNFAAIANFVGTGGE